MSQDSPWVEVTRDCLWWVCPQLPLFSPRGWLRGGSLDPTFGSLQPHLALGLVIPNMDTPSPQVSLEVVTKVEKIF